MKLLLDADGVLHVSSDFYDDGLGRNDDKRWLYCEVRQYEREHSPVQSPRSATDEVDGDPTCLLCITEMYAPRITFQEDV